MFRTDDRANTMDTDALLRFFGDPKSYPDDVETVERFETHISWVFLAGRCAYKVKKPVKLDFLDFSTLAARERACRRELRLNRRLAGNVYHAVMPLYLREGRWSFTGAGEPAEFCIEMARLPADRFLDVMLAAGAVRDEHLGRIADLLASFYAEAKTGEKIARGATASAVAANVRGNLKSLRAAKADPVLLDAIESAQLQFIALNQPLFAERIAQGKVRDGHGDLRAEHVCLTDPPVIFDCIEFNDRFRHLDVLDDVAFLIMDLDRRGDGSAGKRLWSLLAQRLEEDPESPLFDFYRSYRATVRAKVAAIRDAQTDKRGTECLDRLRAAAGYCAAFHRPTLFVMVGLMGSGKSTLAQALCNEIGATMISSDAVRKELFEEGGRNARYLAGIYSAQNSELVYREICRQGVERLRRGTSVVLDATFSTREHRAMATEVARSSAGDPVFLECRLSKSEAIVRLDRRFRKDRSQSDGRPELYEDQVNAFEPLGDVPADQVVALNANLKVREIVDAVLAAWHRQ